MDEIVVIENSITWVLTVLMPSMLAASAFDYFGKKYDDLSLKCAAYLLYFMICIMIIIKVVIIFEYFGIFHFTNKLTNLAPIVIGVVLGTVIPKFVRALVLRLAKLNSQ